MQPSNWKKLMLQNRIRWLGFDALTPAARVRFPARGNEILFFYKIAKKRGFKTDLSLKKVSQIFEPHLWFFFGGQ